MEAFNQDKIHPVDRGIREEILRELEEIERRFGVIILYACETGSRGWGFSSPDSDYDVRFIYTHPLEWYLRVTPERDVIELPIDGLLDINGWELRKALGLLKKGNATLVEWLSSPIVYRQNDSFVLRLQQLAEQIHRPERSFYHYLHMARGNFRDSLQGEQVRLKKYLYVLRPVLACLWIERETGPVPMRFEVLVDRLVTDAGLRQAIDRLLIIKRNANEAEYGAALPEINSFLQDELHRLELHPPSHSEGIDHSPLDRMLFDFIDKGS